MKSAHEKHLYKMLKKVQDEVSNYRLTDMHGATVKTQCPVLEDRGFRKLLYFNPGLYRDSSGQVVKINGQENNNQIPDLIPLDALDDINLNELNLAASNASNPRKGSRGDRKCNFGDNK